ALNAKAGRIWVTDARQPGVATGRRCPMNTPHANGPLPIPGDPTTPPPAVPGASSEAETLLPVSALPAPEAGAFAAANVPGYQILEDPGRGGMGVVYKARPLTLDRTVALKMILVGGHAGEAALPRFRTEAEAVARLQHPGVVQVFEVG